jgi:flagellar biosynthesis protein FlhB
MGLTLGVGTLALSSLLPGIASSLVSRTQAAILTMDPRASDSRLLAETGGAIVAVMMLTLPLAVLVMVAGVAGNLVSGGLVFSVPGHPVRHEPDQPARGHEADGRPAGLR